VAGDEVGRTQGGNNNAYCQDNETSWLDWRLLEKNADLFRFFRSLIRFRRDHPSLRRSTFFQDAARTEPAAVTWHGNKLGKPDWSAESRLVAMHLPASAHDDDLYIAANAHWEPAELELPPLGRGRIWSVCLDTTREAPADICEPGDESPWGGDTYLAGPRSVVVLVGRSGG
jgi:glycogen operon protein